MPADPRRVVADLLELRAMSSQPVDGIPQTVGGRPSDGPPLGSHLDKAVLNKLVAGLEELVRRMLPWAEARV